MRAMASRRWVLVIALSLVSSNALAAGPTQSEMAGHMEDWFDGEQSEAFVFLGFGVASAGGGAYLVTRDDDMARGAGWTLIAVGGLMTIFSITYSLGLSPKHDELKDQLAKDPAAYKREETDRMEAIADRFVLYRWTEVGLFAIGAGLATYGLIEDKDTFTGIGIALAGEAAIVLGLDYFAERRAHTYLDHLHDFDPASASASPLGRSKGFMIGWGGSL
jgi:hypothetical protein